MNKAQLKAIINFASKDSTRPIINGLYIEQKPDTTKYVATDGYVLVEVVVPNTEKLTEAVTVVPRDKILKAIKVADKEDIKFSATDIILDDVRISYDNVQGNYPEYENLIKRDERGNGSPMLNASYISTAMDLFKAYDCYVTLRQGENKLSPVYFEGEQTGTKLLAVVMPLKS